LAHLVDREEVEERGEVDLAVAIDLVGLGEDRQRVRPRLRDEPDEASPEVARCSGDHEVARPVVVWHAIDGMRRSPFPVAWSENEQRQLQLDVERRSEERKGSRCPFRDDASARDNGCARKDQEREVLHMLEPGVLARLDHHANAIIPDSDASGRCSYRRARREFRILDTTPCQGRQIPPPREKTARCSPCRIMFGSTKPFLALSGRPVVGGAKHQDRFPMMRF
jgi:hypothetical protein